MCDGGADRVGMVCVHMLDDALFCSCFLGFGGRHLDRLEVEVVVAVAEMVWLLMLLLLSWALRRPSEKRPPPSHMKPTA